MIFPSQDNISIPFPPLSNLDKAWFFIKMEFLNLLILETYTIDPIDIYYIERFSSKMHPSI